MLRRAVRVDLVAAELQVSEIVDEQLATKEDRKVQNSAAVVASFREQWVNADARRRQRETLANVPDLLEQPVVSPKLHNNYPLGAFNSKAKIMAELDARHVNFDRNAPFRRKKGDPEARKSLKDHLEALPDVFVHKIYGGKFLKRMCTKHWPDAIGTAEDAENDELRAIEATFDLAPPADDDLFS
mmetsp:Transcript_11123/g.33337  ORF Transcript_11123/g.33337 Transcript_11123/m.33337 type:complete len:185 (+) Transcript_11123:1289-1843(+)